MLKGSGKGAFTAKSDYLTFEFNPWNSYGRKDITPTSCPLASSYAYTYTNNKLKSGAKEIPQWLCAIVGLELALNSDTPVSASTSQEARIKSICHLAWPSTTNTKMIFKS